MIVQLQQRKAVMSSVLGFISLMSSSEFVQGGQLSQAHFLITELMITWLKTWFFSMKVKLWNWPSAVSLASNFWLHKLKVLWDCIISKSTEWNATLHTKIMYSVMSDLIFSDHFCLKTCWHSSMFVISLRFLNRVFVSSAKALTHPILILYKRTNHTSIECT